MNREMRRTDANEMFEGLVRNALDFLERSIDELEQNPKHSLIHLCTAIELFLKSRLLAEHWVLIYKDLKKAKLDSFRKGDCESVGITEAITRIKDALGFELPDEAKNAFAQIRKHRNQLVHFFHPAYEHKPDSKAIKLRNALARRVVDDLCLGWFHLYPLLTESWGEYFGSFLSDLERLQLKLTLLTKPFRRVKFKERSKFIEERRAKGDVFLDCEICSYPAMRIEVIAGPLFSATCVVCEIPHRFLLIPCPGCSNTAVVDGFAQEEPGGIASAARVNDFETPTI